VYAITKELNNLREVTFYDEGLDHLCDLDNLNSSLISSLDPYLRVQIQKRGITVIQNTYTGFDTEYDFKQSRVKPKIKAREEPNRTYVNNGR